MGDKQQDPQAQRKKKICCCGCIALSVAGGIITAVILVIALRCERHENSADCQSQEDCAWSSDPFGEESACTSLGPNGFDCWVCPSEEPTCKPEYRVMSLDETSDDVGDEDCGTMSRYTCESCGGQCDGEAISGSAPGECIHGGGDGGDGGDSPGGSFVAGTLVELEAKPGSTQGSLRQIEQLQIGDRLALGGRVVATMVFEASQEELFFYSPIGEQGRSLMSNVSKGTSYTEQQRANSIIVAGGHAVLEAGIWKRVRNAEGAFPLNAEDYQALLRSGNEKALVYDVDVALHRLSVRPAGYAADHTSGQRRTVFADFSEVDMDNALVERFEQSLLAELQSNDVQIEL